MKIEESTSADAPMIGSVLREAAGWLAGNGKALWSTAEIGEERILRDASLGLYHVARQGADLAGVIKFELEDSYFWPEISSGTSAFVHKLAIRRAWAKKGVSTDLLAYARIRARHLGRDKLRLDCAADRQGLRSLYEAFGFVLHDVVRIGNFSYARYELQTHVDLVKLQPVA